MTRFPWSRRSAARLALAFGGMMMLPLGVHAEPAPPQCPAAGELARVDRLKAIGTDVILMDLQFAPRVIEKADAEAMVNLIATAAKRDNVDLFRRFALMRDWMLGRHISFRESLAPDGLHMNDWSYGCL